MAKSFQHDWVTCNSNNRSEVWLKHLQELKSRPTSFIEFGVFEGRAACWFLDNLLTHPDSTYTGFDPYCYGTREELLADQMPVARDVVVTNLQEYGSKATLFMEPSSAALQRVLPCSADVVRVDGEHTAVSTLKDMIMAWDLLKPGGILIVDDADIKLQEEKLDQCWGTNCPRTAVESFMSCFRHAGARYVWIEYDVGIRKTSKSK